VPLVAVRNDRRFGSHTTGTHLEFLR
jgi:hypothetical protein